MKTQPTKYSFLAKLVNKLTRSNESNNQSFTYFGHLVDVQSGTVDYMDVTVYSGSDRDSGVLANFSFDFWLKELNFLQSPDAAVADTLITAFGSIYRGVKVSGYKASSIQNLGKDLNKIIMAGASEITDASNFQICVHLGNDCFIYIELKDILPEDIATDAASIIRKAEKGELPPEAYDAFRVKEISYDKISESAKADIVRCYGIGKPEDYTPEFYKQLIVEGAFELDYV